MAERAGAKSRRPGANPLRQEIQDPHPALRPASGGRSAAWACATRRSSLRCGSSTSRCSSGTTRPSVTTPCTIRSPRPKLEDVQYLDSDPGRVRANAYDFVCNGTEIGGGSIRIHDSKLQAKMFELLGFTAEQAQERFGFLMNAFKYGAPPHGGLAFGFDRLCSLFGGSSRSATTSPSRKTTTAAT